MEYVIELGKQPWAGQALAVCAVVTVLFVLFLIRRAGKYEIRAFVCEVGRSGVLRINAGKARGVNPGQVFTVFRVIASRKFQNAVLETIRRQLVPIGQARVVTAGLSDALCKFWSGDNVSGVAREGDTVVYSSAGVTDPIALARAAQLAGGRRRAA